MTPEFEKALGLTEQEHFSNLSGHLGRVTTETTNKYAANNTLRSGGYVAALRSGKLKALEEYGNGLAEAYVRLASKTDLLGRAGAEGWLVARLERALGGKGVVDALVEKAKAVKIPQDAFRADSERNVEALRSRVKVRLQRQVAEAVLQAKGTPASPPSSPSFSTRELIEERIAQLDRLDAKMRETPFAFGRYLEPLRRWLETTARLLTERGLADVAKRVSKVGYMGTGDPVLDEGPRITAHRQFLVDLLQQAESDPQALSRNDPGLLTKRGPAALG